MPVCLTGMKVPSLLKALLPARRSGKQVFSLTHTRDVLDEIFGEDVHLARVKSLANGVTGVLNATMVSVSAIGRAYAEVAYWAEEWNQAGRPFAQQRWRRS